MADEPSKKFFLRPDHKLSKLSKLSTKWFSKNRGPPISGRHKRLRFELFLSNKSIVDLGDSFDTLFFGTVPGSIAITMTTKQKAFSNWTFTKQFGIVASSYLGLGKFVLSALEDNKTEIKFLIGDTLNYVLRVSKACRHVCGGNELLSPRLWDRQHVSVISEWWSSRRGWDCGFWLQAHQQLKPHRVTIVDLGFKLCFQIYYCQVFLNGIRIHCDMGATKERSL